MMFSKTGKTASDFRMKISIAKITTRDGRFNLENNGGLLRATGYRANG